MDFLSLDFLCLPQGFRQLDAGFPWQRSELFPGGVVMQMFSAGGACVCQCVCADPESGVFERGGGRKHTYVCLRWSLTWADCHHCSYWWNVTLLYVCVCLVVRVVRLITDVGCCLDIIVLVCVYVCVCLMSTLPHSENFKQGPSCAYVCVFVHLGTKWHQGTLSIFVLTTLQMLNYPFLHSLSDP